MTQEIDWEVMKTEYNAKVVVTRILQFKLYIWMEEPHNRAGKMALFKQVVMKT